MRKGSIELTLDIFFEDLDRYIDILNKVISDDSPFTRDERAELFESFVLKVCSIWEVMVENLMVDCLNRNSSQYAKYMAMTLPRHMSHNQCRAMILGIGYLDFKGISDIKRKSKNILVEDYNPFSQMPSSSGKKIDEFYKFRNFIAHKSIRAEKTLENVYLNTYKLKKVPTAGNFLLAQDKKLKQPRLGIYLNAFSDTAISLAEFFDLDYQDSST